MQPDVPVWFQILGGSAVCALWALALVGRFFGDREPFPWWDG